MCKYAHGGISLKKYYMDKTCMSFLRVIMFYITMGLIVAIRYFLYFIPIIMWIFMGIFGAMFIAFGLVWLPLYFERGSFMVSRTEIIRNTGFFIRTRQIMKTEAIQYISLVTTPLSRYTGFNFIALYALGGTIVLPFLSKSDAEEISKFLNLLIHSRKEEKG